MMTPEAVQNYVDTHKHIRSVHDLVIRRVFGVGADPSSIILNYDHKCVFGGAWIGLRNEDIYIPLECFHSTAALDKFCAEFVPKGRAKRRAEFEKLREEFCEQPCVDH